MDIMTLLKIDLGIIGDAYDPFLFQLINAAKEFIKKEGVSLTENAEDTQLVVMYAAYLYRKRATDEGMPRMLRWALNNRLFGGGGSVTV